MGFQAIFWKFPLDFLWELVYPNRRLEKTNDSPVRGRIESEENAMMPLVLADTGEELTIQRIGGSAEVKRHLENLGFVAGGYGNGHYRTERERDRQGEGSPCGDQRGNGTKDHGLIF